MSTITLPKTEYEILRRKASLYEQIFSFMPKRFLETEDYSRERIKEFLEQDKINKETKRRLKSLLKSL